MPLELQFAIFAIVGFVAGFVVAAIAPQEGRVAEIELAELREFNPHLDLTTTAKPPADFDDEDEPEYEGD
jgi:hypothetical protein